MNAVNDIVVADDNPAILDVLSAVFRERGYTVRTASDGFTALTLIGERTPRFLLSDLYMPGMSGFELLSVVRRRFPRIAVIAMSGAHPGEGIPAGIAADGFYAKGASSVALLFEILSAIESDASRQSARAQAPIWVSAPTAQQGELPALCVACPECLRPFVHSLYQEETLQRDGRCPHCLRPMRLAIASATTELDITTIPGSVREVSPNESRPSPSPEVFVLTFG